MKQKKSASINLDQLRAIRDHERARDSWVLAICGGHIVNVARITVLRDKSNVGRLRVAVSDYRPGGVDTSLPETVHFIGSANGGGYDKLTAAMAGATIGGEVLSDHCDPDGHDRLQLLCDKRGWYLATATF